MAPGDARNEEAVSQFNDHMDLPHQRPAHGVNAPALFRHVGYRIAGDTGDPLRALDWAEAKAYRARYIEQLNEILMEIQDTCGAPEVFLFGSNKDKGAKDVSWVDPRKTLLTVLNPRSNDPTLDLSAWRFRLRVDVHTEYYYITLILDQKPDGERSPLLGSAWQACLYEKQLGISKNSSVASTRTAGDVETIVKFFYEDVWNTVDRHLLSLLEKLKGQRFTEFRSIALRCLPSLFDDMKTEVAHPHFIVEDKQRLEHARTALHKWVNANGDVIRGILKYDLLRRAIDRDANCVLCEVLDGGAVYGSSLGQNTPVPVDDPKGAGGEPRELAPLRYFIVYNDLSNYQLGRLVRLTNVLGELRMAAVFDLTQLSNASVRIQTLGNKITAMTGRAAEKQSAEKQIAKTTLSEAQLKAIQKELYEIGSSNIPGGLAFRAARSRYYAAAFKSRLRGMRVQRIEGWEPYDSFVRRKIYQVFSFVSEVGVRFEALANRIHRLVTVHNAQRLNMFQDNVAALVGQMTKTNGEILKINVLGEAIGMTAFAYYGGHIIADLITVGVKFGCSQGMIEKGLCKELTETDTELVVVFSVILALLLLPPLWKFWLRRRLASTAQEQAQAPNQPPRIGASSTLP
jgi:Protein of unknown function (DUF3422)